jgi:colanic acid biosynthesis protein WcaH
MRRQDRVPEAAWRTVVEHVPVVSVDLVVRRDDAVVLGKRANEPAKGEWFVPGGRVHKHERLADAVARVAREEVGLDVGIEKRLGVYEHFYETADYEDVGGKHYVPVGFVVRAEGGTLEGDDQHSDVRWARPPFDDLDLHPYVRTYLEDAGVLSETG